MKDTSERIQFLDFMRGFAVIFMVMGHSIDSVLSVQLRATEGFRLYDAIRGFTAPIFLFVSGYAYIVATENKWNAFRSLSKPMAKRLMKIGLLIMIGYALHFPFFSFGKLLTNTRPDEFAQFFQADVLHCVAASLLILQVLLFMTRTSRQFAIAVLVLDVMIIVATPLIWQIDFAPIVSPVLSPYFNQTQLSIFPLFPFAAFLLTGVVAGHFYLEAKRKGSEDAFRKNLLVAAAVAIALGIDFDLLPIQLYPTHDYWKASPNWFLIRIGIVTLISVAFSYVRRMPPLVERNLIMLGKASLLIYPIHLLIVYGSAANDGLMQRIGQSLAAQQAVLIGLLVLSSMVLLTYAWNFLRTKYFVPARLIQLGLVSTILYSFLTRPW